MCVRIHDGIQGENALRNRQQSVLEPVVLLGHIADGVAGAGKDDFVNLDHPAVLVVHTLLAVGHHLADG